MITNKTLYYLVQALDSMMIDVDIKLKNIISKDIQDTKNKLDLVYLEQTMIDLCVSAEELEYLYNKAYSTFSNDTPYKDLIKFKFTYK